MVGRCGLLVRPMNRVLLSVDSLLTVLPLRQQGGKVTPIGVSSPLPTEFWAGREREKPKFANGKFATVWHPLPNPGFDRVMHRLALTKAYVKFILEAPASGGKGFVRISHDISMVYGGG
jgi:hypothetical protein